MSRQSKSSAAFKRLTRKSGFGAGFEQLEQRALMAGHLVGPALPTPDAGVAFAGSFANVDVDAPVLKVKVRAPDQVKLSWTAVPGATSYVVERQSKKGGDWRVIKTTTDLAVNSSNLQSDRLYRFHVTAVLADGSVTSEPIAVRTADVLAKAAKRAEKIANMVEDFRAAEMQEVAENLDKIDDPSFRKRIKHAQGGFALQMAELGVTYTPMTIEELMPPSASKPVVKASLPPTVSLTVRNSTEMTVNWTAATGAIAYKIDRTADSGSTWTTVAFSTGTRFIDVGLTPDTAYGYRIYTIGSSDTSAASSTSTATTNPVSPGSFAASTTNSTTVALSWTTVANATSYTIERSTNNTTFAALTPGTPLTGSDTSYNDTSGAAGTTYYYRISTVHTGRSSDPSATITATTKTAAPTLTATPISGNRVDLSWNAQSTAFEYHVERSDDAGTTWNEIVVVSAAHYSDASLSPDTAYKYRVSATNAGGTSAASTVVDVTTKLGTPANVAAAASSSADKVTVSWDAVTNATGYAVLRSTNQSTWTTLDTSALDGTATSFDDTTAANGTTYYYKVSAVNTVGTGAPAFTDSALMRPAAPTGLALTLTSPTSVTAHWNTVTSATAYLVEHSLDGGTNWSTVGTPSGLNVLDSGLDPNTLVQYRVSATNGTGTGATTSVVSLTTAPTTPANLAGTFNDGTNAFDLTWDAVTEATSYVIERSVNSGTWAALTPGTPLTGTDDSYSDAASIQPGTSYRYRISSTNANGTSAVSALITKLSEPGVPTLTGTAASATVINLSWTAQTSATAYTLQSSPDAGTTWTTIYNGANTSYSNTSLTADTAYSYQVLATNATGDSVYCTQLDKSTMLGAVSNVAATTPDSTSATVTWDAVTHATGYKIERSANAGSTWTVLVPNPALTGSDTTYTDTGLASNTAYVYRVSAINAVGTGAASSNVSITTRVGIPTAITATAATNTSIALSWTGVTAATTYKIEQLDVDGVTWNTLATQAGTTYTNTGLTTNTAYSYRVTANGTAGLGTASAAVSGRTLLAAVSGFSATAPNTTQVNLSWTASTGATGYRIEKSTNSGSTWAAITISPALAGTANSYSDTGLTAGTSYQYRMAAISTAGTSANTSAATVITRATAPVLAGTVTSATQVALTWSAITSATSYLIERSSDSGANWTSAGTPTGTSANVTGLTGNTAYQIRLFAVNASGNSAASNVVTLTTQLATPTGLTAGTVATDQIRLNWSVVSGATSYKLEKAQGTGAYAVVTASPAFTGSSNTYLLTGLTAGTAYKFRLTATNGAASSATTSDLNVTTLAVAPVLTTTTPSTTQINLTWTAITSATSYKVEMSGNGGSTWSILGTPSSNSYNATGLTVDAGYSFRVSAINGSGTSAASNVVATRTLMLAPTGLTVLDTDSESVTLAWDQSDNASTYVIERSADAGTTWATVAVSPALAGTDTSYQDIGLTGGTSYKYRVSGSNVGGRSAASSVVTAVTLPGAPTVTATAISGTQINLTWTTSATATSYRVERSANDGGTWSTIASPTATSFSDFGVSAARNYQYRVSAVNSSGAGEASTPVAVSSLLNTPTSLTATTASATAINLGWTAPAGATGYRIERSVDTTTWTVITQSPVLSGTATFFANTGLTAGTVYYYRITATAGSITSPTSSIVRATTVLAAPTGLAATSISTSQINLTWTASTNFNLTGYKLQRSVNGTTGWTTIATPANTASTYSNTGLTSLTKYYYRIIAVSIAGDSAASAVVNATTK